MKYPDRNNYNNIITSYYISCCQKILKYRGKQNKFVTNLVQTIGPRVSGEFPPIINFLMFSP